MSSDSEGHSQMLFSASSADGRQRGARTKELDQPDPHRMTLLQIRRPSVIVVASLSPGSEPRRRCRGPFPLHSPDDLSCLG